jgi:hypothetical protein
MWRRLWFLFITLFFLLMNVLLWRAEFGGRHRLGSPIPPDVVWQRMLQCSDNSSLEIRHHGARSGFCRWSPSLGEGARARSPGDLEPEGMVKEITGYSLDFDGTFTLEAATRLRINAQVKLDTNEVWQEFHLRLNLRPYAWEVNVSASNQTIQFISEDDAGRREDHFTFDDLKRPEKILHQLGGPIFSATFTSLGLPLRSTQTTNLSLGLKWEARKGHRLPFGHSLVPVYRLEAHLLDRYRAVIYVTESGEIFRVELPDDLVLINDRLSGL